MVVRMIYIVRSKYDGTIFGVYDSEEKALRKKDDVDVPGMASALEVEDWPVTFES